MNQKSRLLLNLVLMFVSAWAVYTAMAWPWRAALFPMAMGIPLFFLSLADLALSLLASKPASEQPSMDFRLSEDVPPLTASRRTVEMFCWIIGFYLIIVLLGFYLAVPLFVFLCLRLLGREGWLLSLLLAALAWSFVYILLGRLLQLPFPEGWLSSVLPL
ncbi:MAG: tripartite tricarboxylate transporter TctB family protein [Deltaproteobacteria bacterium]|nr:tripartite tricarboxylate transporter TctB family protein [Deltaproteobacteria bacterium]